MFLVFWGVLCLILTICYGFLYSIWTKGWKELQQVDIHPSSSDGQDTEFTIIVPLRNEEKNVRSCIDDWKAQRYGKDKLQLLLVDDHSEDATYELAKSLAENDEWIEVLRLDKERHGKKAAIQEAMANARMGWIVCSDADCKRGSGYLQVLDQYIVRNAPLLISGPVKLKGNKGAFDRFQELEFAGLNGIGAASIALGKPNMCNGANLAYAKKTFDSVDGFSGNEHIASGDDEFLMHKVHRAFPGKVHFLKAKEAIVTSSTQSNWRQFIAQRKRWASKHRFYKERSIQVKLALVYLFYLSLVANLFFLTLGPWYLALLLTGLLVKLISEWRYFLQVLPFYSIKPNMRAFLLAEPIQLFYVLITGVLANSKGYAWKERYYKG